jgi:hypothetical protein
MIVVGPARLDIHGASYEKFYKQKDFTLPAAPTLTSLTPNTAVLGASPVAVTVTGTNFTEESVLVVNGAVQPTTYVSATSLTSVVPPPAAAGTVPCLVQTFSHQTSSTNFTFTAPP